MSLRWRKGGKKLRVEMSGDTLATFESCRELAPGTQLAVGRDTWMGIQWIPTAEHFKVDLNGIPIRGAGEVHPDTADVASTVLRIGLLNVIVGAIAVAVVGPWAADGLAIGVLFLILGLFVARGSRAALGIAIGLLAIALLAKIILMIGAPRIAPPLVAVFIYGSCLLAMVRSYLSAASDW
jgi:hypothetical protein